MRLKTDPQKHQSVSWKLIEIKYSCYKFLFEMKKEFTESGVDN